MTKPYGVHWFRRDLRIAGNENLRHNWKLHKGRVLGLFCVDPHILHRPDFSNNRFAFFLKTLRQLRHEMQLQGGDLFVIEASPTEAFSVILSHLKSKGFSLPHMISWGQDYEPFSRARDQQVVEILQSFSVPTFSGRDHLIFEPHEVVKDNKEFYQVYSAYFKRWYENLLSPEGQRRLVRQQVSEEYYSRLQHHQLQQIFKVKWSEFGVLPFMDCLDEIEKQNSQSVTISIPPAGFQTAYERLQYFKNISADYAHVRDFPAMNGTSQLSLYQKNGSLVASQILQTVGLRSQQFVKEIAWREFYYSILWHRPEVQSSAFLQQYKNIPWPNNREWFQRWCEGKTGFPIVDAGMRQLNTTGWMHNRVRMIVASFLTKDLLIDWRWGEKYFMQKLLDGDLAANNGGWQWAASTGCDPQPYFRIFNPWLQGEKFDPEADYIKEYVPELRSLSAQQIHTPHADRSVHKYPAPLVDHAVQKIKALQLFALNP